MNDLIKNKKIIFFCLILIVVTISLLFIFNKNDKIIDGDYNYETQLKKYEANTFIPVYVTESDIANKYLNDYKYLLLNDVEESYRLLNIDYKNNKFNSFEEFENYINERKSLLFYQMHVKEYSVFYNNGYRFYYIKTTNENTFIFKELSIMNYEVYLDNYSVEFK